MIQYSTLDTTVPITQFSDTFHLHCQLQMIHEALCILCTWVLTPGHLGGMLIPHCTLLPIRVDTRHLGGTLTPGQTPVSGGLVTQLIPPFLLLVSQLLFCRQLFARQPLELLYSQLRQGHHCWPTLAQKKCFSSGLLKDRTGSQSVRL